MHLRLTSLLSVLTTSSNAAVVDAFLGPTPRYGLGRAAVKQRGRYGGVCDGAVKREWAAGCGGHSRLMSASSADGVAAGGDDLSKLTVVELKDRLRGANLAVGGRKQELIDRLTDYHSSQLSPLDESDTDALDTSGLNDASQTLPATTAIEDLQSLTVPLLKEKLRELGLPVSGKKADLVERLQYAMAGDNDDPDDAPSFSNEPATELKGSDEDDSSPNTGGDGSASSTLMDILEEIITDEDDADVDGMVDLNGGVTEPTTSESGSLRKARRKKYWKTQEVRELVKANDPRAASRAEEMIAALERMAKEEGEDGYLPDSMQYTLLIDAYAKSGTEDSIRRAEGVIERILSGTLAVPPSAQLLNAMIAAYANLGDSAAAEKATTILDKMIYLREFGGGTVKPTVHSYSIAISAWAKCDSKLAAEEAEIILNRLFDDYEELLRNDDGTGYANDLRPNNIVFNSAIDAWARCCSPDSGDKAVALLQRMEVLSRMDDHDVRPDTITFNTCIKAYCNSGRPDAAQKAEEVLAKLETNPQYPKRNGGVLVVRPNRLSYNTVINAWAKSNLPEAAARAEDLLLRMIKSFKSEPFATITPDSVTFASVLNALAKSTVKSKALKCSAILKAMEDLHEDDGSYDTRPNIIVYNTVLNACCFSARSTEEERRQALKVAVETFNQIKQGKYVSADAVSYGNVFKALANLMPPGRQRNTMASQLFKACCDEGLVGGMCLDEIRRCVPPRVFLPLLADCGYDRPLRQHRKAYSVSLQELPRQWTQNVKRGDMKSRQRGSFQPDNGQERRTRRERGGEREKKPWRQEKAPPVIRRPGLLVEYGSSGKDL